jgi:mannosyltransferase OCH1-like enzyme
MGYRQNTIIPKIIHQFWDSQNGDPPSKLLLKFTNTWKEENPSFEYKFWNSKTSEAFLVEYFHWFIDRYNSFRYDVLRWDAVRYLILFKFGGVYVDMDYECLEPLDWIYENKNCCFGLDPPEHNWLFNKSYIISNAFMAVVPQHPFFQCLIEKISNNNSDVPDKFNYVLETTGPFMLSRLYEHYSKKDQIWLIPSELNIISIA